MVKKNILIWVLKDNRAGNFNQALGLAEHLCVSDNIKIKNIIYNKLANLPNFLKFNLLLGFDKNKSDDIFDFKSKPDLIISAGRKTAPIALFLKKYFKNNPKIIQIMKPDFFNINKFDLIILPSHDNSHDRKNIFKILGALHKITNEKLNHEILNIDSRIENLKMPRVALIVGGDTKKGIFGLTHAKKLANITGKIIENLNGSVMVTYSRRTSDLVKKTITNDLNNFQNFIYDPVLDPSNNPYLNIIANSDIIIVTGDSVSMCSECCYTGKPVYIFEPCNILPRKHKEFLYNLYKENYARPLLKEIEIYKAKKLQDIEKTVLAVKEVLDEMV